MCVTPAFETS
jgi:uncharacterized protein (TIGR00369 family)